MCARARERTVERALQAACPGLLHSIRDIPHSSHTCKNTSVGTRCLRCLLLIRSSPFAATTVPRHLWAKGTSEPFTGQENPRFLCRGKPCPLAKLFYHSVNGRYRCNSLESTLDLTVVNTRSLPRGFIFHRDESFVRNHFKRHQRKFVP